VMMREFGSEPALPAALRTVSDAGTAEAAPRPAGISLRHCGRLRYWSRRGGPQASRVSLTAVPGRTIAALWPVIAIDPRDGAVRGSIMTSELPCIGEAILAFFQAWLMRNGSHPRLVGQGGDASQTAAEARQGGTAGSDRGQVRCDGPWFGRDDRSVNHDDPRAQCDDGRLCHDVDSRASPLQSARFACH
jgi:hypothetical protein